MLICTYSIRFYHFEFTLFWTISTTLYYRYHCRVCLNPSTPSIVYEGGTTQFTAVPTSAIISSITWTVNDQPLNMLSGISQETRVVDGDIRRLIPCSNISTAYNNAIVRCTAVLNTGATVSCCPEGRLVVQGECKYSDVA